MQQEDDPEGEVNLDCQPLVPGNTLLHQAWGHKWNKLVKSIKNIQITFNTLLDIVLLV